MKKTIMMMMAVIFSLVIGFSSCNSCGKPQDPVPVVDSTLVDSIAADSTTNVTNAPALVVENLISMDRQEMYLKFKDNYRWFETCVLLPEFIDSENATSDPVMVVNVFQSVIEKGNGFDTWVYKIQHFADGTVVKDSTNGFWLEDLPLNDNAIVVKYKEAYDKIMATNAPKPHSKNCVLRNPLGPVECNAQYVFGNIKEQLWVDAKTGDVRTSSPAFPEEKGFKMPLGEWP